MKTKFELRDVSFEWNDDKAKLNIQNHGIRFEEASEVFLDPFVMYLSSEIVESETRDKIIGMTENWQVLLVVYTERNGDAFRLISARRATSKERKQYEKQ